MYSFLSIFSEKYLAEAIITKEGRRKAELELADLKNRRRPEITERIRSAKEHGDLKENAEYAAAKDDQSFAEARIHELEQLLLSRVSDAPSATDSVAIGSTVTVKDDTDRLQTYTIVGMNEAEPCKGKISNESPVGRALLHRKVGDSVSIDTPRGIRTLVITEIS